MLSQVPWPTPAPTVSVGMIVARRPTGGKLSWFADGLERMLRANGHAVVPVGEGVPSLIINFTTPERPRPVRRRAQGTFVVAVVEVNDMPADLLRAAYPILIRSLSNLLICLVSESEHSFQTYFVTLEQGCYSVPFETCNETEYFGYVYRRLTPLATSQLVVNNIFHQDLLPELWNGNARTRALRFAGQQLNQMNLLPAPFPISELLPPRDMAHVKRLFGLGGLSYGNLSVRHDDHSFWMSASGVDKGNMQVVGRDMLLITGFDPDRRAMHVSVPPNVEPRRASVDAIEHWMLYKEHPAVGAIVHVHAWMDGVPSTSVNYPCGTAELAREVAELVRKEPDPSRAVVGLKNHGLTITGRSLPDIFERITGRLQPQVPMA
ncbi:MAG TPA: class II aldolase/adducin family protein [Symbiobacteriaceae bacterium]|nr:class II aldolase/adducin family protein [Symbiobacteriaceae bacterium]